MILAIDPGKDKTGLAVLDEKAAIIDKLVVFARNLPATIQEYTKKHSITEVVIGQSAAGQILAKKLQAESSNIKLSFVSEKNSSLEARQRYWQENKPRGLWKLIPSSLRIPPVPVDDWAAVILGERHLKG
ncbi:MAG: Holliday junction resolvase RuvX [Candidatus Margulisbacteria bacterium]|nr:Holliday junction resolvase RuvX [Candidatus Margulisiibacteriota bacterium]